MYISNCSYQITKKGIMPPVGQRNKAVDDVIRPTAVGVLVSVTLCFRTATSEGFFEHHTLKSCR